MIAVGAHAVLVQAAEIEVAQFAFLLRRERVGVAHRPQAHVGVHRHPAVGGEVNLAPVVVGLVSRERVPAGLPAGGNAIEAAEGDEEQRFLPAIPVAFGAAIIADVPDGGVLSGVTVLDVVRDPVVALLRLPVGVRLSANDLLREPPKFGREYDVRSLAGKLLERGVVGITGPDIRRLYIKPNGAGGVVILDLKPGRLAR